MKKNSLFTLLLFLVFSTTFNSCEEEPSKKSTNTVINTDGVTGKVTDIDGNVYKIIKIDNQWWMAENLKVTKYKDGTAISNIIDNTEWPTLTTGAYCSYNNDANNASKYGMLYNWYAVNTGKLAPAGWHIPTDDDWNILNTYVSSNYGSSGSEAKALAATFDWSNSTTIGTPGNDLTTNNSTRFSALPGGSRIWDGSFNGLGYFGNYWSSTDYTSSALGRYFSYNNNLMVSGNGSYNRGYSVRCVKD